MTLLGFEHAGKELLDQNEVGCEIHFEDPVGRPSITVDDFGPRRYNDSGQLSW
jgi:hypothetical protein